MKRVLMIGVIGFVLLLGIPSPARAQSAEVQQLLLDMQKLAQLKGILNDMYKGYQV